MGTPPGFSGPFPSALGAPGTPASSSRPSTGIMKSIYPQKCQIFQPSASRTKSTPYFSQIRMAFKCPSAPTEEHSPGEYQTPFNVGKDISQITGFIQENYTDINLDATMICDRFRISPSYLSHMFKKRTGMRLIDYIHGVRVAKARELLRNTDMTIKAVGTAVGYISNASFSTTFKRYESVTPRQFREAARSDTK